MPRWHLLMALMAHTLGREWLRARAGLETEGNPGFRVFLRTPAIELGYSAHWLSSCRRTLPAWVRRGRTNNGRLSHS